MNSHRLQRAERVQIIPEARISFTFDGRPYCGYEGDTIASALLANGVRIVGRSFKVHRPRGVWGSWHEEPNAVVTVHHLGVTYPNCLATQTHLEHGMQVKAVNAFPSASFDVKAVLSPLKRWLGTGFYYKTFMWPDWHWYEPVIRRMAGLGAVTSQSMHEAVSDQLHDACDMLVVGAGPVGVRTARLAAEAGHCVVLVNDRSSLGGTDYHHSQIEGMTPRAWTCAEEAAFAEAGGRLLNHTVAFGAFDHGLVGLVTQPKLGDAPTLTRLRTKRTVLATGALERSLPFSNNDLPGIQSLSAGLDYLIQYGVKPGRCVGLASVYPTADVQRRLAEYGIEAVLLNTLDDQLKAVGRRKLKYIRSSNGRDWMDALWVNGGLTPSVHLWSHAGGKLSWSDDLNAFIPNTKTAPESWSVVGAAAGYFDLEIALEDAKDHLLGRDRHPIDGSSPTVLPVAQPRERGSQWIDLQHDVTVQDVDVAVQENYRSVEHVKRYTTLGMAIDQGKSGNMVGLAAIAEQRKACLPDVGTTTYRPPFVPLPLVAFGGQHGRRHHHAPKRLVLENQHRASNAALCEYGGWLRPGWYGRGDADARIEHEVLMTRRSVGILDASPLGKIEVLGPDARAFMQFMFYNRMDNLKPMHCRYGFMLTEGGTVFDDAVVSCVTDERFIISCSSSHVAGVDRLLESWRQDGHNADEIFIHNATAQWATITVAGPQAVDVLSACNFGINTDATSGAPMRLQLLNYNNAELRVATVSFCGERSFEISLPTSKAQSVWKTIIEAAKGFGGGPIGLEAMSVMRAEKGFIIVGKDTDGYTQPQDIGFSAPRLTKKNAYVGDRSLFTAAANDSNRRQWVGLVVPEGDPLIATGAHVITVDATTQRPRSIGIVSSSYFSPTLSKPIALAWIESGASRLGQRVDVWHLGEQCAATITEPCFYDKPGERLRA